MYMDICRTFLFYLLGVAIIASLTLGYLTEYASGMMCKWNSWRMFKCNADMKDGDIGLWSIPSLVAAQLNSTLHFVRAVLLAPHIPACSSCENGSSTLISSNQWFWSLPEVVKWFLGSDTIRTACHGFTHVDTPYRGFFTQRNCPWITMYKPGMLRQHDVQQWCVTACRLQPLPHSTSNQVLSFLNLYPLVIWHGYGNRAFIIDDLPFITYKTWWFSIAITRGIPFLLVHLTRIYPNFLFSSQRRYRWKCALVLSKDWMKGKHLEVSAQYLIKHTWVS